MEQSSEIQSSRVSLGERLTALDNRVNEFIPDINTKVDNLSEGVHRLELQIQPLAAENKNISKEIHNLERQMSAENKNLERQMSAENKNLERQMAAENKNLALQVAAENKKLALQMAAENKNLSLQIQPLVDDRLNAKKIRTIVIGGAIVAVSGALASGLFAAL